MGNSPSQAIAENYVSSHTQVIQNILNSTNQQCNGNCQNISDVELCYENIEGDVEVDIKVKQTCQIDTNCVLVATTNNCLSSALSQSVQQNAEAITKGLRAGSTESNNITYLLTQYTQQIYNIFTQSCYAQSYNLSTVKHCVNGAEAVYFNYDVEQTSQLAIDCALESDAVSTARNEITNYISQIASSKSVGAITPAVIIAVVICVTVILAVVVKKLKPGMIIFLFILFSLIGVGLYFLITWITQTGIFEPAPVCRVEISDQENCIFDPETDIPGRNSLLLSNYENGAENYIINNPDYECLQYGSYTGIGPAGFGGCRVEAIEENSGQYLDCIGLGYAYNGVDRVCYCHTQIERPHKGNIYSNVDDVCQCKYGHNNGICKADPNAASNANYIINTTTCDC